MKSRKTRSYEWLIYIPGWMLVLLFPVVNGLLDAADGTAFSWSVIGRAWLGILPFLILFLIHDRLLVPRLFLTHRIRSYLLCVIAAVSLFGLSRGLQPERHHIPAQTERYLPKRGMDEHVGRDDSLHFLTPAGCRRPPGREPHRLPLPLIMDTVIAMLMLGFNLSVVLLFRYQKEKEHGRELENSHLQHELEYLKAQINPHFFMNMLNNIHGMVEVDPPRAQEMILGLSKLMRYVLYDGANPRTQFVQEVNFIANYVELMRQRYSDRKVRIELNLPEHISGDLSIPPLLFIVFIENAFKHGISYRRLSFVEIDLSVEEKGIRFRCRNSNIHRAEPERRHGVGLENVRKRLNLLYGCSYTLHIEDEPETYTVTLIIPRI